MTSEHTILLHPPFTLLAQAVEPLTQLQRLMVSVGLDTTFTQTPWTAWLVLLGAIFMGVLAGRAASEILRRSSERLTARHARGTATILRAAATPASLFLLTIGLSIGLGPIALEPGARDIVRRSLNLLYVISIGWFLFNLVDLVDLWLRNLSSRTSSTLDDQIAPLVRKTLRIFLVVLVGLYIAQNIFNQNITAWLAGLGIAGLAVSLAAQDSIKNLFGSITIFLDKPFAVGETIAFDGFEGTIEEIGFRSSKLRTFDGALATIPNSRFIDNSVKNVSRRPSIRKIMDVSIEYGTPPRTILEAVEAVKRVLAEPGIREAFDWEKAPPRVHFDEMRADNLNIKVFYWYQNAADWWGYCDHLQRLNLRVMEELLALGVEFAFPTQTMVLTNEGDKPLLVRTEAASEAGGNGKGAAAVN